MTVRVLGHVRLPAPWGSVGPSRPESWRGSQDLQGPSQPRDRSQVSRTPGESSRSEAPGKDYVEDRNSKSLIINTWEIIRQFSVEILIRPF